MRRRTERESGRWKKCFWLKPAHNEGLFDNGTPQQRVLSSREQTPTDRAAALVVGFNTNTGPD